ncbi:HlyD family secretion protein [Rhizobacter sp. OV335]|uniref:HlyD family secretion protein n=1 Tax=Rhizobacter sp. OV335 TaxID=1500264 RepID=UPI0009172D3C|nr:HlyD family efflux transporter periplasmic adaptor subunit [Rhizobacter sp. OV335]SHM08111.1 HlyD family secretion protein [Rhizobacter sp. OV335]
MKHLALLMTIAAALAACSEPPAEGYAGYAEGDYVRLSAPVAGTLTRLHLQRGDRVDAAAPAFVLEQDSERAAREEAESRLRAAQQQLLNLQQGRRPDELAAARAQLAQAQAALALSNAELARTAKLVAEQFNSPATLDQARSKVASDQAHVNELAAQLRVANLGARTPEIAAAAQEVKAAQAQLDQADWRVAQKTQRVPASAAAADVVDVLYREGEYVPLGGPVLTLLPPGNIKARFFVPQAVVGALRVGQAVSLHCDGCGAPIAARLSFVAREAEFTSPLIYSRENRAALVFMVEARPEPADARRLHPGQPLQVLLGATS